MFYSVSIATLWPGFAPAAYFPVSEVSPVGSQITEGLIILCGATGAYWRGIEPVINSSAVAVLFGDLSISKCCYSVLSRPHWSA